MTTTILADPLPAQVLDPLLKLAGQLIGLAGYFAVGGIIAAGISGTLRYYRGGEHVADYWREVLSILFCAAVAARTFDIASWLHG